MQLLSRKSRKKEYALRYEDTVLNMEFYGESWFATLIYSNNHPLVAQYIRSFFPEAGPDIVDGMVRKFREDHSLVSVDYKYEDIPLIADDKNCFEIRCPMFREVIKLTKAQETEVLAIIAKPMYDNQKIEQLLGWFNWYCQTYGFESRYKRDRSNQANELMWQFFFYHGISAMPHVPWHSKEVKLNYDAPKSFVPIGYVFSIVACFVIGVFIPAFIVLGIVIVIALLYLYYQNKQIKRNETNDKKENISLVEHKG